MSRTSHGHRIVDAHVHIGEGVQMRHDAESLLRNMDEAGIDFSIVSPMDRHLAVANREGNDLVLQAVKRHPDRLAGMAVANPWFGSGAVAEIRRALGEGLTGVNIHSVYQGFRLADHLVDPILEAAAAWDVPVYAHTGTAGLAEPFHLIELARRFPTVNFLMGHGGERLLQRRRPRTGVRRERLAGILSERTGQFLPLAGCQGGPPGCFWIECPRVYPASRTGEPPRRVHASSRPGNDPGNSDSGRLQGKAASMIIDAHTHLEPLGDYEGKTHSAYGIAPVSLPTYLHQLDENGVDACFLFMCKGLDLESRIGESNDGLARLRDQAPDRLYPWGTVHPAWPEQQIRAEIRRIAKVHAFHGLKFSLIVQGYPLSAVGMDVVAEEAIDHSLPVTFHDGSPEYCSAIQTAYYARKYPKLKVLSAHSGLRELWPDMIDAVKELPNLWLCLSGPTQWGIQTLYDRLGPERLLFGSDGGLGHRAITTAYLRRIERLQAPREHKDMILGGNALKFVKERSGSRERESNCVGRPSFGRFRR